MNFIGDKDLFWVTRDLETITEDMRPKLIYDIQSYTIYNKNYIYTSILENWKNTTFMWDYVRLNILYFYLIHFKGHVHGDNN